MSKPDPRYMNVTATLREVETHLRYIGQDDHADMVNKLQILAMLMPLITYEDIVLEIAAFHRTPPETEYAGNCHE